MLPGEDPGYPDEAREKPSQAFLFRYDPRRLSWCGEGFFGPIFVPLKGRE